MSDNSPQHAPVGPNGQSSRRHRFFEILWLSAAGLAFAAVGLTIADVPTTVRDFFIPGSQPNTLVDRMSSAIGCSNCHAFYDEEHEPYRPWAASMMGQATRDPIFHACLAIANQDAAFAGDMCLRCHTPQGWVSGRSDDPTGGNLTLTDFQGVSCSTCHRMVDPVYEPGVSPIEDISVLERITELPQSPHNASFVLDHKDRRRGPFQLTFTPHPWLESPFHKESNLCATCHEVSNPIYTKQADGSYRLNALDTPHETGNKYDQFPIERTFSEWANSAFALGPIDMTGRFGGNDPLVSTCQDCHMPTATGTGCDPLFEPPVRNDLPQHHFNGGNTWVLRAVRALYDDYDTDLSESSVDASIARAVMMLRNASDLELYQSNATLITRIINESGHKLPTGYPEGRQMWINVRFFDSDSNLIMEHGAYDASTAALDKPSTKVYEAKLGLDAWAANEFNKPAGPSFHFVLNNIWLKDNRIPPRGFTNAAFEAVQAAPIGYTYADGQHWDDTEYPIPAAAARAEVRVYFQTTSKEYIEFLRDANTTNTAGQVAYDQWVLHGRSAPVEMDMAAITLDPRCIADFDGSGGVDGDDIGAFFDAWLAGAAAADVDGSGGIDGDDISVFFIRWQAGC